MQYTSDLRPPVMVITGTLNPAIFSPQWVALNLFDFDEGAVLNIHQAIYPLGSELRQLTILDGVGWSVTQKRCEIFITSLDPEIIARAEEFAVRLITTLPHTPWGSLGINLQFQLVDDVQGIADIYNSPENFEGQYQIGDQVLSTEILVNPNLTLNVQRNVGVDTFSVFFNNHHHDISAENAGELIPGSIVASLERSRAIMTQFFQLTEESSLFLNPAEGEVVNVG